MKPEHYDQSELAAAIQSIGGAIWIKNFLAAMEAELPSFAFADFLRKACDQIDPEETDAVANMVRAALEWDQDDEVRAAS